VRIQASVAVCLLLAGCGGDDAQGRTSGGVFELDQTCGLRVRLEGGLAASLSGADTESACAYPIGPTGIHTIFVPIEGPLGHFQLDADDVAKGATGMDFAAEVRLIAKDRGGTWNGEDCSIDVTEHVFLREGEFGEQYRAVGSGRCAAAAVPADGGEPVTISAFDFVVTVSFFGGG
jgi:hypothetical protein